MTPASQKISLIREWAKGSLCLDLREDIAAKLLAKLDAIEPEGEEVERAAEALRACLRLVSTRADGFYSVNETDCEPMARAVLSAIRQPVSPGAQLAKP